MTQEKNFPSSRGDVASGKTASDENFPVVSWLSPPALRSHIVAFYAYARTIDDVADSPVLAPEEKIAHLDLFARAVCGEDIAGPDYHTARQAYRSLVAKGITPQHCVDLTVAFKQDATKLHYKDWDELMEYCNFSAAPVGRFAIDLHRETKAAYASSDALCKALQVLNFLQDFGDDYKQLGRVYLPQQWMRAEDATTDMLAQDLMTPSIRRVVDQCLDNTDALLMLAERLPCHIKGWRFAMKCATIVAIAKKLSVKLRHRDPLAERVVLSKMQYAACFARGVYSILRRYIANIYGV